MTRRLLLSLSPGEIWAAVVAESELAALRLVRVHGAARPGDIYRGRVVALQPELPAVLVDIGEERPAFLAGEDVPRGLTLHGGDAVTAKVIRAARADKATGITMKLAAAEAAIVASATPPMLLHRADSALAAVVREFADAEEIVIDDPAAMAETRRHAASPVRLHHAPAPLFEAEGVAAEIDTALASRLSLPSGGAITIEPTVAAVMIDVDGGRRGAVAANLAAARAVARQIRLRDLSGPIVIDFIGMKERGQRARVEATLRDALGGGPQYLGWTRLGHFELVLTRRRPSLSEQLFEQRRGGAPIKTPLSVALEALRALQREARALPSRRSGLRVHPEVAASLERNAAPARRELEARLGYAIPITAEQRPRDTFEVAR